MGPVSKNLMYKYNFKCLTENKNYETWDLSTNKPSKCPINDGHIIDSNNIEIICKAQDTYLDIMQTRTVEQTEENITQELFRVKHYKFQCPSNSTTKFPVNFKYPVLVLGVKLITKDYNDLDILNNYGTLNGPVGVITSNIDIGSSNIMVNNTAIQFINRGVEVILNDGSNIESLGDSIKVFDNKLVTERSVSNNYLASSPTYVSMRSHNISDLVLHKEIPYMSLGDSKIGGSIIKPGVNLSVEYTNLSLDTNKDFSFLLEYMY